jgi:hypothetical protein
MSLWFKHDAHFHEHPKCLRLRRLAGNRADSAELGWFRIIAAAKRIGSWSFEDEEHLKDAAGRYFPFVALYREVGLLDGLTIHNGEEYQGPMSGRERVAQHRARNAPVVTPSVTDVTPRAEQSRKSRVESPRESVTSNDPADGYWSLTGRYPKDAALSWIDRLTETYGAEAILSALVKAHVTDRSVNTLLGRTEDLLRSDARQLDRAEKAAEKARVAEKRSQPHVLDAWKDDYRRALEERYDYGGDAA